MILLEHLGKEKLAQYGILVPRGGLAHSGQEAQALAEQLSGPVVVKSQIPAGGRGRAGGIKRAQTPSKARRIAEGMLGKELLGHSVEAILVEECVAASHELYLALTIDAASAQPLLLFSPLGGMEVEELAQKHPGELYSLLVSPDQEGGLMGWFEQEGMERELGESLGSLAGRLLRAFVELDALLLEVNPLAVRPEGGLVALDCKLEVDDSALFRHPEWEELKRSQMSPREQEAAAIGVSYVELEGDVALIASGAGLGMASLDMLWAVGLRPANFLDTGGGITQELMRQAVKFVLAPPEVRGALINLYGGINPMVEAAQGIVQALAEQDEGRPVVVKLAGNQQEEAWKLLEERGIPVVKAVHTEEAAEMLARLLERGP